MYFLKPTNIFPASDCYFYFQDILFPKKAFFISLKNYMTILEAQYWRKKTVI